MSELKFSDLEKRLNKEDLLNLTVFNTQLKTRMIENGIYIGTYLVGSSTFPENEYIKIAPPKDMDLLVCAYDKKYLIPFKDDLYNCKLTQKLSSLLAQEDFQRSIETTIPSTEFGIAEPDRRDFTYIPYGRPNLHINFENGIPIHLVVNFHSPKIYKVGRFRFQQRDYEKSIKIEQKNNNPFCFI